MYVKHRRSPMYISILYVNNVFSKDWFIFNLLTIKSINFPESLTYIGFSVFENCKNLKDIYYTGSKESWSKINISSSSNDELYKAKIKK